MLHPQTPAATAFSILTSVVWIARHPTARIVGITLGHDQRVPDLEAFKTPLVNAVRWAGCANP